MSPGNHLFREQKVKGQGHKAQKTVPAAWVFALLSAGFSSWKLQFTDSVQ